MPWTMLDAPSDRDYYEQFYPPDTSVEDICGYCGANFDEAEECEADCYSRQPVDPTEESNDDAKTNGGTVSAA